MEVLPVGAVGLIERLAGRTEQVISADGPARSTRPHVIQLSVKGIVKLEQHSVVCIKEVVGGSHLERLEI